MLSGLIHIKNSLNETACLLMLQVIIHVCWDNIAASKGATFTLEASTALATRDMNSTKITGLVQVKSHSSLYPGLLVLKTLLVTSFLANSPRK